MFGDIRDDIRQAHELWYGATTIRDPCLPKLTEAMNVLLSDRERDVLAMRFGLSDGIEKTYSSVGSHYGISRERVRQICEKGLRKLRHPSTSNPLIDQRVDERMEPRDPFVLYRSPVAASQSTSATIALRKAWFHPLPNFWSIFVDWLWQSVYCDPLPELVAIAPISVPEPLNTLMGKHRSPPPRALIMGEVGCYSMSAKCVDGDWQVAFALEWAK